MENKVHNKWIWNFSVKQSKHHCINNWKTMVQLYVSFNAVLCQYYFFSLSKNSAINAPWIAWKNWYPIATSSFCKWNKDVITNYHTQYEIHHANDVQNHLLIIHRYEQMIYPNQKHYVITV